MSCNENNSRIYWMVCGITYSQSMKYFYLSPVLPLVICNMTAVLNLTLCPTSTHQNVPESASLRKATVTVKTPDAGSSFRVNLPWVVLVDETSVVFNMQTSLVSPLQNILEWSLPCTLPYLQRMEAELPSFPMTTGKTAESTGTWTACLQLRGWWGSKWQ